MTAQLIDGKALSTQLRELATDQVSQLKAQGCAPGLAVILIGNNQASQVYVRNKVKACEDMGIYSLLEQHPADLPEATLLVRIKALNADASIHGILVQLPLPDHIDEQKIIEAISPAKDVDGFHPSNVGKLALRQPGLRPCTPKGIAPATIASRNLNTHGSPGWSDTSLGQRITFACNESRIFIVASSALCGTKT